MSKLNSRLSKLLVGLFSFLIVGALPLGLYCYLDLKSLNQQRAYPTLEEALDNVEIEGAKRCSFIVAGRKIFPLGDYLSADGAQLEDQPRSFCSLEIFSFEL
jgi:hypothetical protein